MVLGVNTKNRRGASIQVDYLIHIQEIKPWPPSQSLRSLRSVLIQWENGDRNSGSTDNVVPSLGSIVGEGKIEFNESFRLPVTLIREMSSKGKNADSFQKNCLEFNLCEPRRDKIQLLATAVIDLADYGVVKETISVNAPMSSNRSFKNTSQPVLHVKIQPIDKGRSSSSSRDSLLKGVSHEKNGGKSVSALMNGEYAEEAEIASFTDDDVSSHSSLTNGGLHPQNEENGTDRSTERKGGVNREQAVALEVDIEEHIASQENLKESSSCSSSVDFELQNGTEISAERKGGTARERAVASKVGIEKQIASKENLESSSHLSSVILSADFESPVNGHSSVLNTPNSNSMLTPKYEVAVAQSVHSSSSAFNYGCQEEEPNISMTNNCRLDFVQEADEKLPNSSIKIGGDAHQVRAGKNTMERITAIDDVYNSSMEDMNRHDLEEKGHFSEDEPIDTLSQDSTRNETALGTNTLSSSGGIEVKGNILKLDRLKHVKSVRSSSDSSRSNGLISRNQHGEVKEIGALGGLQNSAGSFKVNERKNAKVYSQDTRSTILNGKIQQMEHKIKMLEGELREAAGIEAALYSVVAEHGSSISKVHAPARRLSRLYLHACKESSQPRRASAARSAVSGLVLVAKACGNDVPRLTFWLSNSVVLRAIVHQEIDEKEPSVSGKKNIEMNGGGKGNKMISSSPKWKLSSSGRKENNKVCGYLGDLEDPHEFISALEKVEAWIFSRIVESIWWQTLTPHMQSNATKAIDEFIGSGSKKRLGRMSSSGDHDQGNFSLELWKKAFKDACERLCPLRAGGHECGCLPVLAQLIMEQCVARLDVAMFNAILRDSADEIPTDPVSDPISDSRVLPIPAGKSSFGAGAQLKNAIGNWSRWLTDLFGIDDDSNEEEDDDERQDISVKSFHHLNALSDLMMLPKDMLLNRSIRKEVCPTFGAPLIKRVLDNFVTDEFCPDPIPEAVLEALESEDPLDADEESVTTIPHIAAPPFYLPPLAASVAEIIGESGSQSQLRRSSSLLRKSYTSDDELDELNSPLASIFHDGSRTSPARTKLGWKSKETGKYNSFRYELLREVWTKSE